MASGNVWLQGTGKVNPQLETQLGTKIQPEMQCWTASETPKERHSFVQWLVFKWGFGAINIVWSTRHLPCSRCTNWGPEGSTPTHGGRPANNHLPPVVRCFGNESADTCSTGRALEICNCCKSASGNLNGSTRLHLWKTAVPLSMLLMQGKRDVSGSRESLALEPPQKKVVDYHQAPELRWQNSNQQVIVSQVQLTSQPGNQS